MEKVYVNVDYQVLVGGAIKPVRIYWHDGRALISEKRFTAAPPKMSMKEFATRC